MDTVVSFPELVYEPFSILHIHIFPYVFKIIKPNLHMLERIIYCLHMETKIYRDVLNCRLDQVLNAL